MPTTPIPNPKTMTKFGAKYLAMGNMTIKKALKNVSSQYSFWVGLGITLLIILLSLFLPCPTASQFQLFRIALSIGLASFAGSLPGFFKTTPHVVVKTGTGLAVFLICYFTNPATIVLKDGCDIRKSLQGKVMYAQSPLPNVKVEAGFLNEYDITNGAGEFDLPYSGELKFPLLLNFRFGSIDTVVNLSGMPEDDILLLNLPDTIPTLLKPQIEKLISNYLQKLEEDILAGHQREMYRHHGKASSLQEINTCYRPFEKLTSKYRNIIHFTNGFTTLTTHKSIRACGIQIDPMVPYHAYRLEDYSTFIFQDTSWQDAENTGIHAGFAFLNNRPVKFTVNQLTRKNRLEYRATTLLENNIRYVKTFIRHSGSSNWVKLQDTEYKGTRPREEYVLRYMNGSWQLFDTHN